MTLDEAASKLAEFSKQFPPDPVWHLQQASACRQKADWVLFMYPTWLDVAEEYREIAKWHEAVAEGRNVMTRKEAEDEFNEIFAGEPFFDDQERLESWQHYLSRLASDDMILIEHAERWGLELPTQGE